MPPPHFSCFSPAVPPREAHSRAYGNKGAREARRHAWVMAVISPIVRADARRIRLRANGDISVMSAASIGAISPRKTIRHDKITRPMILRHIGDDRPARERGRRARPRSPPRHAEADACDNMSERSKRLYAHKSRYSPRYIKQHYACRSPSAPGQDD